MKKNYLIRIINRIKGFFYDHIENYEHEENENQNMRKIIINLVKNKNFE